MKIFLIVREGPRRKAQLPYPEADHAEVEGACPACGVVPLKVAGTGRRASKDDRAWEADGVALCCRVYVGTIRVETNTLFGVREDEAVLRGRCRVY